MNINELLEREQVFIQYLVSSDMSGTADDVQTLFGEIRRLRKIEDPALIFQRENNAESFDGLMIAIENNPRPEGDA